MSGSELQAIVERSYHTFKRYKAIVPLDACTHCCLNENQESELVSLSVRLIPFELLYDYNTAAKTPKPSIDEFKHFLPRILDYTAQLKFLHHSAELVLSRFEYYDKGQWNKEEQQLIQSFGLAFFQHCLTVYPLPELERIDSVLIMLKKANVDIGPLLFHWTSMANQESILHFNDLISQSFEDHNPNKLMNSFSDNELSDLLVEWLNEDSTKNHFLRALENFILEPPPNMDENKIIELSWSYEKIKARNAS
ncbi:MAG: hypothetical protein M3R08_12045 [Bacteroidota bacterium]|nr:hypothetical protein [Bacteroidota bacterium]